ncbi:MAG: CsgG/HfaB family protein [Candidatus Marinimicrobia bacterium]|nr:CsgG/HfaB family protein [Candidatus Neomarinimicrobiota bacterium]
MNLFLILFLSFAFSQSGIHEISEERDRLLILPADKGKGRKSIEATIADLVSSEAVNLNRFEIIDRNHLGKILNEQKLQMSGVIRDDDVVNYGEIASAEEALIVSILSFGQRGVPPTEYDSDDDDDEEEGGFWERVGTELAAGIIRSMFSNDDSKEKYPHNIQTSLQAEVRKIDIETGKSLHSFKLYGEHTGGTRASSLGRVLNQVRRQISTKLRRMFLLKSEVLVRNGSRLTMLLGSELGVKKGTIFEIMKPDVHKTIREREFILPGKSAGLVRVINSGDDASEGLIIRQYRGIKTGYSLVEKPQHFGGWLFSAVYNESIDEKRLDIGYEFFPFSRFSFSAGGALGVVTDSRKDRDFKASLMGGVNFRFIHTRFLSFGTSLNLPLSLIFRQDDQPENVHKFQFTPTIGLNTEFLVSRTKDIVLGVDYILADKSDRWVYTEGEGDEAMNFHGEWDDGVEPSVNPAGLYFSIGIRFINF